MRGQAHVPIFIVSLWAVLAIRCTLAEEIGVRVFEPSYYDEFEPETVLDFVVTTPGFRLEASGGGRGLSNIRTNVLIDGVRPPPKGASSRSLLQELPARRVEQVELIQTGARADLDMQGFQQVLNVVTRQNPAPFAEASYRFLRQGVGDIAGSNGSNHSGALRGAMDIGVHKLTGKADVTRDVQKSAADFAAINPDNPEQRLASVTLSESDDESFEATGALELADTHIVTANAQYRRARSASAPLVLGDGAEGLELLRRFASGSSDRYSASVEYRATPLNGVTGSLAFVASRSDGESSSRLTTAGSERESLAETKIGETAGRAALRWTANEDFAIGVNGNIALNKLEGETRLIDDGVPRDIGAGRVRVTEMRSGGDVDVSWRPVDQVVLQANVGFDAYELETLETSGGIESDLRSRINVTYQLEDRTSLAFESERSVGQLGLGQFLTSTSLETDIVSAGASLLDPERSWTHSLSFDHRFNDRGVVQLRLERRTVDNPIASIPISTSVTIAQNASPETIDLFSANVSYPLDELGLDGGILTISGGVADSRTLDPVTGEERAVSNEPSGNWSASLRRDRSAGGFSWGMSVSNAIVGENFQARSISVRETAPQWSGFLEWKRSERLTVRTSVASPTLSEGRARFFSEPRRIGLDPAFVETNASRSGAIYSGSVEWRLRENLELSFNASSGSSRRTEALLARAGADSSDLLEREFTPTPTFGFQLRATN